MFDVVVCAKERRNTSDNAKRLKEELVENPVRALVSSSSVRWFIQAQGMKRTVDTLSAAWLRFLSSIGSILSISMP